MTAPARCRSCGAEIRWATTQRGKPLILDAHPSDEGTVAVDERAGVPRALVVRTDSVLNAMRARRRPLYTQHLTACPDVLEELS